jgi:hypothetical protein
LYRQSISNFFNHLKVKLSDVTTDQLVIGSDEELALVNSITAAFPDVIFWTISLEMTDSYAQMRNLIENLIKIMFYKLYILLKKDFFFKFLWIWTTFNIKILFYIFTVYKLYSLDKHCDEDTECVHCSSCDKWHHMKCVSMTSYFNGYNVWLQHIWSSDIYYQNHNATIEIGWHCFNSTTFQYINMVSLS